MYKRLKKLLIITAVITCATLYAYAESEFVVLDSILTEYTGNADVVVIPAMIGGEEVAVIDTGAFQNKDMHTVIIEDGVEVIQTKAFIGCSNLQYVKSPESMLLINENAFFECSPLLQIDVSDNTYVMDAESETDLFEETESESYNGFLYSDNTITGYTGEETIIVIPDSINDVTITTIAASAFEGNTVITSVTIPDTVTTIGDYAFKGCTALAEVSLSKNLCSAGLDVFSGCSSLKSITIPGTLARVSNNMFYGCKALKEVVLENGVKGIGQYAFYQCEALEKIQVPGTVTRFDQWSFGFCKKLKTVYIPNGCTDIGTSVFYYCSELNNIYVPDTVTTIGSHCFRACKSLSDITLSKSLGTIQNRTFNGCAFTEIEIPHSVTKIGVEAFYQCQKLKNIEMPATITSIGAGTFFGCKVLDMLIIYGTDTTVGKLFTYKEDTSMGANTMLYVVAGSVPEQHAKENSLPYKSMSGTANVVKTYYSVNDTEEVTEGVTVLVKDDTVYAKYKIINVGNKTQNLRLLVCLYDKNGRFIRMVCSSPNSVSINSLKEIDVSMTIEETEDTQVSENTQLSENTELTEDTENTTNNSYYAKVMLVDGLNNITPLFVAKEL